MEKRVSMCEMTLVDLFAGLAKTGILVRDTDQTVTMGDQAREAYEIAEAKVMVRRDRA